MAKKVAETKTRVSLKQKFEEYRKTASNYIYSLHHPARTAFFSVKSYEITPTGKKPNAINAPELLAIVGTAKKLGNTVILDISGVGDRAQLDVVLIDMPAEIPAEMRYY